MNKTETKRRIGTLSESQEVSDLLRSVIHSCGHEPRRLDLAGSLPELAYLMDQVDLVVAVVEPDSKLGSPPQLGLEVAVQKRWPFLAFVHWTEGSRSEKEREIDEVTRGRYDGYTDFEDLTRKCEALLRSYGRTGSAEQKPLERPAASATKSIAPPDFVKQHFRSLEALTDWLCAEYDLAPDAARRFSSPADPRPTPAGPYVFRGEPGLFAETKVSSLRFLEAAQEGSEGAFSEIDQESHDAIHERTRWLLQVLAHHDELGDFYQWHEMAQHYGLYSDGLDFSTSLAVAATFAHEPTARFGVIGVLDLRRCEDTHLYLATPVEDLWRFRRPRLQQAVWVRPPMEADLKESYFGDSVVWFSFDQQKESFVPRLYLQFLLNDIDDEVTRTIVSAMNSCEPLPDSAAGFFANRLGTGLTTEELVEDGLVSREDLDKQPLWEIPAVMDKARHRRRLHRASWRGDHLTIERAARLGI